MNWYEIVKTSAFSGHIANEQAFKSWFGGSKVVDQHGRPLVCYKGMSPHDWTKEKQVNKEVVDPGPIIDRIKRVGPFPTFDPKDKEPVHVAGFFTNDPNVAHKFMWGGAAMYPVFLKIVNPAIFDAAGKPSGTIQFGPEGKPFREAIRSGKYDGVIIRNTSDEGDVYIPIQSNQIKSATGNSGNFDPNDERLIA